MKTRPASVTIIGALFVATGVVGVAYHATELDLQHPFDSDVVWAVAVRLLAILGGAFVLRGRNWARWLVAAWLAYHIGLSAFHSLSGVIVHVVVLVVVSWVLFRREASAYFRGASHGVTETQRR